MAPHEGPAFYVVRAGTMDPHPRCPTNAPWHSNTGQCVRNSSEPWHWAVPSSVLESANPASTRSVHLDAPGQRHGQQTVSGTADPGVVKQDKSSRGSVDTTKKRSDKGKQPNTEALCQPPRPLHCPNNKQTCPTADQRLWEQRPAMCRHAVVYAQYTSRGAVAVGDSRGPDCRTRPPSPSSNTTCHWHQSGRGVPRSTTGVQCSGGGCVLCGYGCVSRNGRGAVAGLLCSCAGAVVVNVGTTFNSETLLPDISDLGAIRNAQLLSSCPGGVGPLVVVTLFKNVVSNAQARGAWGLGGATAETKAMDYKTVAPPPRSDVDLCLRPLPWGGGGNPSRPPSPPNHHGSGCAVARGQYAPPKANEPTPWPRAPPPPAPSEKGSSGK